MAKRKGPLWNGENSGNSLSVEPGEMLRGTVAGVEKRETRHLDEKTGEKKTRCRVDLARVLRFKCAKGATGEKAPKPAGKGMPEEDGCIWLSPGAAEALAGEIGTVVVVWRAGDKSSGERPGMSVDYA